LDKDQITYYKSPIGLAKIIGNVQGLISVSIYDDAEEPTSDIPLCLQDCVQQLDAYFNGTRKEFDLQLNPDGTDFQKRVWKELRNVSFGKTRTYLEQSKKLGDVKTIRAVASANGKNPILIIIPCHRILGSDGALTGYAGGIWRKKWLWEHDWLSKQETLF
jgi:methylated-DNA-[protein]-cysteine S-methyltransferase